MIENKHITLKVGTSFFQVVFTVLAVLCTLQYHGQVEFGV